MTRSSRRPLLYAALIVLALAAFLLAACVASVSADGPLNGERDGASPKLTVSYAGQTFREVSGSLTGEDWQHDPSVIYRLSVAPRHPNLVFAAHSDAAGYYLYSLQAGDPVTVEGRAFTVTDTRIVITDYFFVNVNWFWKADTLTIFTCFPQGAYYPTGRLIVTAEAVK